MRKLLKNINKKLIIGFLITMTSVPSFAKTIAVVSSIKGNAFATYQDKTWTLRPGMEIMDMAEIFTEVGSQVTLSDYYDHHFHLSGSGHMKFLNRIVELKAGYLWIQSYRKNEMFSVQTANANTEFKRGEAILSFDPGQGKSQILVLNGSFKFTNILNPMYSQEIVNGMFSFISKEYKDGSPRIPTPIGKTSFDKVTSLFDGVDIMSEGTTRYKVARKKKEPARGIASVDKEWNFSNSSQQEQPVGVIEVEEVPTTEQLNHHQVSPKSSSQAQDDNYIIIKRSPAVLRGPSSFSSKKLMKRELQKVKRKKINRDPRSYGNKSNVPVVIYGVSAGRYKKSDASGADIKRGQGRMPASIKSSPYRPHTDSYAEEFEGSLVNKYKQQMRHSGEVNQLIDELKSYDLEYKKNY